MPRGNPDYLAPNSNVSTVQFDGASIVGGLGGVQSIDGRGRIIYAEKFNNGLGAWNKQSANNGITPYLSAEHGYPFYPPVSVVLDPFDSDGVSSIKKQYTYAGNGRFGVEAAIHTSSNAAGFVLSITQIVISQVYYEASIKYLRNDRKLYILTNDGYVDLINFDDWGDIPEDWFTVKFAIDTNSDYYIRATIGGIDFDLSNYELRHFAMVGVPAITVSIKCNGEVGYVEPSGVGYVIITNDEP